MALKQFTITADMNFMLGGRSVGVTSGQTFYVDETELDSLPSYAAWATDEGWVNAPGDTPVATLAELSGEGDAVTVVSSALPTGASTAALQTTLNNYVAALATSAIQAITSASLAAIENSTSGMSYDASGLNVSSTALNPRVPVSPNFEKLAVSSSSVPFVNWPTSGQATVMITCETADMYWSLFGDATTNHPILRVGNTIVLEDIDPTSIIPEFLRIASDGEVRVQYLMRA